MNTVEKIEIYLKMYPRDRVYLSTALPTRY
jgi:hypothetical protein